MKKIHILIIISLLSLILSVVYIQCLGDDTFIYMRLIKNFIKSGIVEYNPGEPSFIMTSVTWFYAWTWLTRVFRDIDIARYILSFISHILACFSLWLIARKYIKSELIFMLFIGVVFLDPFYLRWLWAGWELSWKVSIAAFFIYSLLTLHNKCRLTHYILCGILAGFAFLTRPEMAVLGVLGIIFILIKFPNRIKHIIGYLLGLFIIVSPWMIYAHKHFGCLFPQTVLSKSGGILTPHYLTEYFPKFLKIALIPQLAIYIFILFLLYTTFKAGHLKNVIANLIKFIHQKSEFLDFILIFIWSMAIFGYLITGTYISSIYLNLFTPFIALFLCILIEKSFQSNLYNISNKIKIVFIILIILVSVGIQTKIYYRFSIFNDRFRDGEDTNFIEFAHEIKEYTQPGDTICVWELGVVGYYCDRYILDFNGIATPEITEYKIKYGGDHISKYFADKNIIPKYIVNYSPKGQDSNKDTLTVEFWGNSYAPLFAKKVRRIAGRSPWGYYDLYILYKLIEPSTYVKIDTT